MGKTLKISEIARTCSVFCVDTIYIYQEASGTIRDRNLLRNTLRYLETPQYLRRTLYERTEELKFAGSLNPLKIPSHVQTPYPEKIRSGDVREGVVIYARGQKFVDVGFDKPLPYYGDDHEGKRIIIKFKEGFPNLSFKQIKKNEIGHYWSYEVKEITNLYTFLSSWGSHIIMTSRKGKTVHKTQKLFDEIADSDVLVVFGSPKRGVHEILGKNLNNVPKSQTLNFFPEQGTETVRLEEALFGTLSILNVLTRR